MRSFISGNSSGAKKKFSTSRISSMIQKRGALNVSSQLVPGRSWPPLVAVAPRFSSGPGGRGRTSACLSPVARRPLSGAPRSPLRLSLIIPHHLFPGWVLQGSVSKKHTNIFIKIAVTSPI
jgi:hypothetical protein